MTKPLVGVKVVEVAMWAFVPSAGAYLADMGAEVIKIEPPSGDPIRGLKTGGFTPGSHAFTPSWEAYNRSKRSLTLDLHLEGAIEVLYRLVESADVFLTSLLPGSRRRLRIDLDDIRAHNPNIVYAVGSAHGPSGPEAEIGGYDYVSFWSRAGVSSDVTPDEVSYPLPPPGPLGDCTSGAMLAGGVCAALTHRAMTGKALRVDGSLLASGMWAMQSHITSATLQGRSEMPRRPREMAVNPLSNSYRTSDGRFIVLCLLQSQRYWTGLCKALGREDLSDDPRFATAEDRERNSAECVRTFDAIFVAKTLTEMIELLRRQDGHWGVVEKVGEIQHDQQVQANGYLQDVHYGEGRSIKLVSAPILFEGETLPARPAPGLGADSDAVLAEAGYTDDEILALKVAGTVL